MGATIAEAFGKEFNENYNASKIIRSPRLRVEGMIKREMIKAIKTYMKPNSPSLNYPINNDLYNLILVEMSDSINIQQLKFGQYCLKWAKLKSDSTSVLHPNEEFLKKLQPSTPYVLVGTMTIKPKTNGDGQWFNFKLVGFITMDEIVKFSDNASLAQEQLRQTPKPSMLSIEPEDGEVETFDEEPLVPL